jgi:DNA-binding NarL/FixJ family response regulator
VIRVAVVDDQALVRMGLRALLETEEDTELVGEAADGLAGLALVRAERPDVVLMDVRMPELDGLEALRRIAADPELSAVRVIVLTTFELDEYVFAALAAGASGFVLKDGEPAELLRAVRVVADGGSLLSPTVTRRVIEHFAAGPAPRTGPRPGVAELTEREREIVAWVATGRSNDEIAAALVVSPATVRTHVSRAMLKLRARDRAQLVVFAIESGLRVEGR